MTLSELLTECYDECNYKTAPATDITVRFKRWINRGLVLILSDPGRTKLRDVKARSFVTVAGQKEYGLPLAMERIDRMYTLLNPRNLVLRDDAWLRTMDPAETSTGTPYTHVDYGMKALFQRPATPVELWVDGMGGDHQVYVTAIQATGDVSTLMATLDPLARAQVGAGLYADVLSFTAQYPTHEVRLYGAGVGGELLSIIPLGATSAQWHVHRLWPTPSAVETIYVDGQAAIVPLVNDADEPPLPESYADLPALYAQMRHWKKQGDAKRYGLSEAEWDTRIGKLNAYLDYPADWTGRSGRDHETDARWNNLGGDYPADGYGK